MHVYIYVHRNASEEGRREAPPSSSLGEEGDQDGWRGGNSGEGQPLPLQKTPESFNIFQQECFHPCIFFKDKKDKENKREWIHKPQSWFSKDGLERALVTSSIKFIHENQK